MKLLLTAMHFDDFDIKVFPDTVASWLRGWDGLSCARGTGWFAFFIRDRKMGAMALIIGDEVDWEELRRKASREWGGMNIVYGWEV